MIKAPNILNKDGHFSVRRPSPLKLADTNAVKLLDELVTAAQYQLVFPNSGMRREWRDRMNECHAELRKRLVSGAEILEFVEAVARIKTDEEMDGDMSGDNAVETVSNLVGNARALTKSNIS